jgi:ribosomal protein S18 acetylase RimI-like enzyme
MENTLVKFLDFTEHFNNVIGFITIFLAILATLFFYTVPYIKICNKILKTLGFRNKFLFQYLLAIRKDRARFSRIFVELCLLKSCGEFQYSTKWWEESIKKLKDIIKNNSDDFEVEISNCSSLTSEKFVNYVDKYFKYFESAKNKKKFNLLIEDSLCFIVKLHIKEGFIAKQVLFNGLMSRYQDNWQDIIDKYVCEDFQNRCDYPILPNELFFTFGWLLWGPSYVLKNSSNRLLQYGFGDESNSIAIYCPDSSIMQADNSTKNGYPCEIVCKLYEANQYIKSINVHLNFEEKFFLDNYKKMNNFIYQCKYIKKLSGGRYSNYYFTSYIWIMFELITDENNFAPNKTITFFEHANIADDMTINFLSKRLIQKTIEFFKYIFTQDCYNKRCYRYCIAYNDDVEKTFMEELKKIIMSKDEISTMLSNRIVVKGIRNVVEIFNEFDNQYSPKENNYSVIECTMHDQESLKLLAAFYATVYYDAFPNEDERETLDNMIKALNQQTKNTENITHILLAIQNNTAVGAIIFDYFKDINSGVIEFIVTDKRFRKYGIGKELYSKAEIIIVKDAKKQGFNSPYWIFCEIEKKEYKEDLAYIFFWKNMGYKEIDKFDYIQPALSPDKNQVETLILIAKSPENKEKISHNTIKNFIESYAKFAMNIEKPKENVVIVEMEKKLNESYFNLVDLNI